jgi:hypothetical protein
MDSNLLQMKEDRLEALLRHRHYSRPLQHELLIPLLTGFKETVTRLTASDPHRVELVLAPPLPPPAPPSPLSVVVRSHRHRNVETRVRMKKGERYGFATACTTAAWQLKTPLCYRVAGARRALPQIGGTVVRCGDEDMFTRHCIWNSVKTRLAELYTEALREHFRLTRGDEAVVIQLLRAFKQALSLVGEKRHEESKEKGS